MSAVPSPCGRYMWQIRWVGRHDMHAAAGVWMQPWDVRRNTHIGMGPPVSMPRSINGAHPVWRTAVHIFNVAAERQHNAARGALRRLAVPRRRCHTASNGIALHAHTVLTHDSATHLLFPASGGCMPHMPSYSGGGTTHAYGYGYGWPTAAVLPGIAATAC
eukprot:366490-Chlamydomonas_euryale.AAC.31